MIVCTDDLEVPFELQREDVYDMLYIFDDEDEAINYIIKEYTLDRTLFISELHELDSMRDEFGREHYLRTATVHLSLHLTLTELMNGKYILWEAY